MILYIAIGSAIGGVARYLLASYLQSRFGGSFPVGTLVVNVTGSFLLMVLLQYSLATPAVSAEIRGLLTTGFCGGYTTFSTFSYETVRLMEDGDWRRAGWYVGASVILSVAAAFAGVVVTRNILAVGRAA
jgi:fluoride exporter